MFETETSLPQKRDLSSIEVRRGQFPKLEKFSKNFKISPKKITKDISNLSPTELVYTFRVTKPWASGFVFYLIFTRIFTKENQSSARHSDLYSFFFHKLHKKVENIILMFRQKI